ncbi:MAG: hypothetical protein GY863_24760 [bacterium]|nr:hypothetical protein [bacterium]
MLGKLNINVDSNIIDEILLSLEPEDKRKFLKELHEKLKSKGIKVTSGSNVSMLAEEHLSLKELKSILSDTLDVDPIEPEETKKLRAFYLRQRINRNSLIHKNFRRSITLKLKSVLVKYGIVKERDLEKWKKLTTELRYREIVYHSANFLSYLELEDVFSSVLTPDEHLSRLVKKVRNVDVIKNMTNSEIVPFLRILIEHENEIPETDKMEALETIIETFISDLHYYKLAAKKYFSFSDVCSFLERHISLPNRQGKIGQKAAGMILAHRIMQFELKEFADKIRIPESYYLTTDVFYECLSSHTFNFSSFRHRLKEGTISEEGLEKEYPYVRKLILETSIPDIIRIKLGELLKEIGHQPVIVRSSSLLEDSASAFSGKYDSYFVANQKLSDEPEEDLEKRLDIIIKRILMVYASALRPEALIYRRERGLLDIDERMSVLIQIVEGEQYGKYFFPTMAGVGLSYNNKVNIGNIKWDDPVLRIGVGLGTGIVDMKGYKIKVVYPQYPDYSTIINYHEIFKSSQRKFDLLNLETDIIDSVNKSELFEYFNQIKNEYPGIKKFINILGRYFLSTAHLDYYTDGIGLAPSLETDKHIFSFEGLKKTDFYKMTTGMLNILAEKFNPADMEFTLDFIQKKDPDSGRTVWDYSLAIVQCRQITGLSEDAAYEIPADMPEENVVCRVHKSVVSGYQPNIEYIVYVDVDKYYELEEQKMYSVARIIGKINNNLHGRRFILIGPGRWGSSLPYHGIKVSYTEIYHTLALVEVARKLWDENFTEPSLGSHFGNDVRESRIINFSITPGSEGTKFDKELFRECPNDIETFLEGDYADSWIKDVITVIDTKKLPSDFEDKSKQYLHIISNVEQQIGVMFLGEKRIVKKQHIADSFRPMEEIPE